MTATRSRNFILELLTQDNCRTKVAMFTSKAACTLKYTFNVIPPLSPLCFYGSTIRQTYTHSQDFSNVEFRTICLPIKTFIAMKICPCRSTNIHYLFWVSFKRIFRTSVFRYHHFSCFLLFNFDSHLWETSGIEIQQRLSSIPNRI